MNTRRILVAVLCVLAVPAWAHVDSPLLTDPCGSCHVGHGEKGEPMLEKVEEASCFRCHGSDDERNRMVALGHLVPSAVLHDMRPEFDKAFSHPVERGGGHLPDEQLPSYGGAKVSHAECVDCHNPHERVTQGKAMNFSVKGYSLTGQYQERAVYEYNICLKCHTDVSGGKNSGRSLVRDFARTGRSQHPVTRGASGRRMPSLFEQMPAGGLMKCSDCHRSDDPDSPRGPHGSRYPFMLSGNYSRALDADENPFAYEFCYGCHDRTSILGNESFPLHREHIEGDLVAGTRGTSCATCHTAHGSADNPSLIAFNLQAVSPADGTGRIEFRSMGEGTGTCTLKCHGYNHAPGSYQWTP